MLTARRTGAVGPNFAMVCGWSASFCPAFRFPASSHVRSRWASPVLVRLRPASRPPTPAQPLPTSPKTLPKRVLSAFRSATWLRATTRIRAPRTPVQVKVKLAHTPRLVTANRAWTAMRAQPSMFVPQACARASLRSSAPKTTRRAQPPRAVRRAVAPKQRLRAAPATTVIPAPPHRLVPTAVVSPAARRTTSCAPAKPLPIAKNWTTARCAPANCTATKSNFRGNASLTPSPSCSVRPPNRARASRRPVKSPALAVAWQRAARSPRPRAHRATTAIRRRWRTPVMLQVRASPAR